MVIDVFSLHKDGILMKIYGDVISQLHEETHRKSLVTKDGNILETEASLCTGELDILKTQFLLSTMCITVKLHVIFKCL